MVRARFLFVLVIALVAAWLVLRWEFAHPRLQRMPHTVIVNELATHEEFGRTVRALLLADRTDALEALADSLRRTDARFPDGDSRYRMVFYDGFENGESSQTLPWDDLLERARAWAERRPEAAMPRLTLAHLLIGRAWAARGHDFASRVKPSQFSRFDADLAEAQAILRQCPANAKSDEAWLQAEMILLHSQPGHDRELLDTFEEGLARYPEHFEWYLQRSNALLPRWGGAPGEWQRFAAGCPKTMPRDYGREVLARIVAEESWYQPDLFEHPGPLTWEEIRSGLMAWHERYPTSTRPMSELVRLAAISGHVGEARTALAALGDTIDARAWMSPDYYRSMRYWLETGHRAPAAPR